MLTFYHLGERGVSIILLLLIAVCMLSRSTTKQCGGAGAGGSTVRDRPQPIGNIYEVLRTFFCCCCSFIYLDFPRQIIERN